MKRRVVTGTYTVHANGFTTGWALEMSAFANEKPIDPNDLAWDHVEGSAVRLISVGDPVYRRDEQGSISYPVKVEVAYDPNERPTPSLPPYEDYGHPTGSLYVLADELIQYICHSIEQDHQPY